MANLSHNLVEDISNLYSSIYDEKEDNGAEELTEEQVWEQVEEWVNSLVEEGYDLSDYTWEEMYEAWGAAGSALLKGLKFAGTAAKTAAKSPAAAKVASAASRGASAAARGAKPVLSKAATTTGKYGTIGLGALAADEVLTKGAGRELVGKGLEQSRKLGPALRGEPTSDTAKPSPDTSSSDKKEPDTKAPTELKGQQVLAKKGGVEGVLDKETGEWNSGKWDETQSSRYKSKKSEPAESFTPYDAVLDYLFENGHVDTLDEAHYIMMEMDSDTIQSIIEDYQ
jgi:hypothetical protein